MIKIIQDRIVGDRIVGDDFSFTIILPERFIYYYKDRMIETVVTYSREKDCLYIDVSSVNELNETEKQQMKKNIEEGMKMTKLGKFIVV